MSSQGSAELAALKEQIVRSLNIVEFYEQRLSDKLKINSNGWSDHVHCVIHQDTGNPNLSINIHTGGFKCFACNASGSIFDFWARTNGHAAGQGFREALVALATLANVDIGDFHRNPTYAASLTGGSVTPPPKAYVPQVNKVKANDESKPPMKGGKELIRSYQGQLRPEHYKYLAVERGLTEDTIHDWEIGWDGNRKYKNTDDDWAKGKFALPVFDKDGYVRNFRTYATDAKKGMKMVNTKGFGSPPRLFGLNRFIKDKWTNVVFCEGEWDCVLLNQHFKEAGMGTVWGALCSTAGCNTFEPEWVEDFHGCNIFFLFDVDDPGKSWAYTHATQLFLAPLSSGKILGLKIIHLPLPGTKESKDVGDYFIKLGHSFDDLLTIIEQTPEIEHPKDLQVLDASIEPVILDDFVACIKDRRYIDQRVRVPITISGQSTKLYHATREFKVSFCPKQVNDECCANGNSQLIPYGDELLIESCMINRKQLQICLQERACQQHQRCTVEEIQKVVMEEFFGHQVVRRLTGEENEEGRIVNAQELNTVPIYVTQPETGQRVSMQDYVATGYIRSHPQTRQVCFLVEHLEPMEEDWRAFKLTHESIERLKVFQEMKVKKGANDEELGILDEIIMGVTRIYKSDDILLTVLLTYLCPLRYSFNGEIIRGWINACILGDSGTGKSATYMRLSDWLELGDLFSALTGSRTGLLYAISKHRGVEWQVQIGRYVMSSGKIIAIDETQEADMQDLGKMALAMDDGWLSVNQVASGGYATQTRTLFLMNAKFGKKISDFAYGCQALTECFKPMFIRRLDIAVFSTGKEDYDFYNKKFEASQCTSMKLTADALRTLVHWAWTRGIDDVNWSEEATKACLDKAVELSNVYGHADDIPLVNPQDFRKNLARLSTAYAVLCGSFTGDYSGVNVEEKHVVHMSKFIDVVYSSSACNLKQHSKQSGRRKIMKDFDDVKKTFEETIQYAESSPDKKWNEGHHFLQMVLILQQQQFIRKRDLVEQLAVSPGWVHAHIKIFQMHNLIEMTRTGTFKATRRFNLFMLQWQTDPAIDRKLELVHAQLGKLAMKLEIREQRFGSGSAGGGSGYGYATPDPFYGEKDPFDERENGEI